MKYNASLRAFPPVAFEALKGNRCANLPCARPRVCSSLALIQQSVHALGCSSEPLPRSVFPCEASPPLSSLVITVLSVPLL